MGKIGDLFVGVTVLTVKTEKAAEVLTFLFREKIPFSRTEPTGETVLIRVFLRDRKKLLPIREKCVSIENRSLFLTLFRYRRRAGLLLGAALALFLTLYSTRFVWDIRITGAEQTEEAEILALLKEHGFYVGAPIPALDKEKIAREILAADDRFVWFKINMRGTVANIDLHERTKRDGIEDVSAPSNLIAAYDAQIELPEVRGGLTVVSIGQVVKKGDLLVSGLIESPAIGSRLVRSRGEVYGKTTLSYSVAIPLETEEKRPLDPILIRKSLKFFSKTINLFKKRDEIGTNYDIIEEKKAWTLFGTALPVATLRQYAVPFETEKHVRTEEECRALADRETVRLCEAELDRAEVLERRTEWIKTEAGFERHVQIDCILDIAREVPISPGEAALPDAPSPGNR